jgi:hypothetical protein
VNIQRKSGELKKRTKGRRAMTAALALQTGQLLWSENGSLNHLHASHCDKRDQGHLGPPLQLQVPHEETGNDSECEVRNDAKYAVYVAERDNNIVAYASAMLVFLVEEVHWVTLEDDDEEESASCNNRDKHGEVEDPSVNAFDADSE